MSDPQQPFGDAEPCPSLAEQREWEGYIHGLTRAMNFKTRIVRDDEGSRVVNDLRDQIAAEIARAEAIHATLREVDAGEAGEP